MNVRRLLLAISFTLGISGLLTLRFSRHLEKPALVSSSPVHGIVAATRNLQAGDTIVPEDLEVIDWPISVPLQGTFTKKDVLINRVLTRPLSKDEPIQQRHVDPLDTTHAVIGPIPDGKRAISLHMDDVASVAGFIKPGSFVDVLATNLNSQNGYRVLQNVVVLAANGEIGPSQEKQLAGSNGTVTLLVDPQDAGILSLAAVKGHVQLALRNERDRRIFPADALTKNDVPAATKRPQFTKHLPTQIGSGSESSASFVVETIAGGKSTTQSFAGREP